MKTCPYCAEEIQDAAIKCRYCQSWLVDEIPAAAVTPPAGMGQEPSAPPPAMEPQAESATTAAEPSSGDTLAVTVPEPSSTGPAATETPADETATASAEPSEQKVEFTHSGERYLLGYTDEFFGIWDCQSPNDPTERFPRTDAGWSQIWQRYVGLESNWMDLRTGQRSP